MIETLEPWVAIQLTHNRAWVYDKADSLIDSASLSENGTAIVATFSSKSLRLDSNYSPLRAT